MSDLKLGIIVAATAKGEIGIDNTLPWQLAGDMMHFRRTTQGHAVVMGKRTYDSLDRPLPNRLNIVVSRRGHGIDDLGVHWVSSLEAAIEAAAGQGHRELWFIGGARIYEESLPLVSQVMLTLVHDHPDRNPRYDTVIQGFEFPADTWAIREIARCSPLDPSTGLPLPSHTWLNITRRHNGV